MENVIIWSLSDNKILCKVSVPPQVAVIKLGFPDILVCGHLDGFVTTIHFKYVATSYPDASSNTSIPTSSQIQNFDALNCRKMLVFDVTSDVQRMMGVSWARVGLTSGVWRIVMGGRRCLKYTQTTLRTRRKRKAGRILN